MQTFGAREVEARAGITAAVLRDWRRHGHLKNIGRRRGNVWIYDRADVLVLVILKSLLAQGLRIESARDAAFGLASFVEARLLFQMNSEPDLALIYPDKSWKISVARVQDVAGIENASAPCSLIVDLKTLAHDLPERVKELWQ